MILLGRRQNSEASRGRAEADGFTAAPTARDFFEACDVASLHLRLTDATRGLVDAAFLAAMADGAILVNAARGPVVHTDALLAELQTPVNRKD